MKFEVIDNGIDKEILKMIEDKIANTLKDLWIKDNSVSATSAIANEPLTLDKLRELQKRLEPYIDLSKDLYKYSIPTYKIQLEDEEDENKFSYLNRMMYGIPVIKPTKTIYIKVQARKHRQKRINKKWLKRYGYIEVAKEIPYFYGIIATC